MQLAGTKSWAIATDVPLMLLFALYVRDASGLRPQREPAIPELEPTVLGPVGAPPVDPAVSKQWDEWWHQLLAGGGFWPEHVDAGDFARVRRDPDIAQLYYWPLQFAIPDFPGLDGSPELQALVRSHYQAAFAWGSARKYELEAVERTRSRAGLEWEIVRAMERALGRSARAFKLDLRLLPVAGNYVWRSSEDRALMSFGMYTHRAAYESWLTGVVRELA
jgi:hypothetical protein